MAPPAGTERGRQREKPRLVPVPIYPFKVKRCNFRDSVSWKRSGLFGLWERWVSCSELVPRSEGEGTGLRLAVPLCVSVTLN